jgi:hypothetical protein
VPTEVTRTLVRHTRGHVFAGGVNCSSLVRDSGCAWSEISDGRPFAAPRTHSADHDNSLHDQGNPLSGESVCRACARGQYQSLNVPLTWSIPSM